MTTQRLHVLKSLATAIASAAGLLLTSAASAAPIVDDVSGTPISVVVGSPLTYTHDFTDNTAPNGYAAGIDSISAAQLKIVLSDDNGNEDYTISFGSAAQTYSYTANITASKEFLFDILGQSLADLSATGLLNVQITATACNGSRCADHAFHFVSSSLTVDPARGVTQDPSITSIPEPGVLALLGAGLAGFAATRGGRRSSS